MPITCDTSVLVPALLAWHPHHAAAHSKLRHTRPAALPAHVYVETFSVLTRLPDPRRPSPRVAHEALTRLDLPLIMLSESGYVTIVDQLAAAGIGGGAAYDALIGATAAEHLRRCWHNLRLFRTLGQGASARLLHPWIVRGVGVHGRTAVIDGFGAQFVMPGFVAVDLAQPRAPSRSGLRLATAGFSSSKTVTGSGTAPCALPRARRTAEPDEDTSDRVRRVAVRAGSR
jgi:predicted nucleic acid-binding protein